MSTSSIIFGEPQFSASAQPQTLVELLQLRALHQPEKVLYTFLVDGEKEELTLTCGELDRRARSLSAWLKPVVATGDRVLLLYPPGLEFITAFFACLYAGAVAVPAYPPRRNRSLLRLQAIAADAQAAVALTTSTILSRVAPGFSQNPYLQPLRWLATDTAGESAGESVWQEPAVNGEALAFLQYTSGSTSAPKGVMLTHANLLYNAALVYHACEHTPDDSYVSWLPTFHDMGFMAGLLQPLYGGLPVVLMSPAAFLQHPVRWLQAISRYKATTSGGPNFAYDLCVRKITAEQRATLDLSAWSIAFNGAEPVRHETLERFSETFAPCGFRPEAFYPCYGLAEATLMVSGGFKSLPPRVKRVQAGALKAGLVIETPPDGADQQSLVCCGASLLEQQILIVNPDTLIRCQANEVGEVWVAGRSVAEGYWNQPEETERTFHAYVAETGEGPFLRTGDLGAWASGELLVTGRLKDLIVIRGLNHYPQDIELTAERVHAALRPGCGAAFSVEVGDEEQLVIVQEVDHHCSDLDAAMRSISRAVAEEHEVEPHAVVLIKHGTIPKTSSGKIQRHLCRAGFLERSLEVVAECRSRVVTDSEWLPAVPTSPLQSREEIENWLARLFAARLGAEASQIELDRPISHYGLDSLLAIELKHKIEAHLGVLLPIVSFFEGPSITALAELACHQLAQLPSSPASLLKAAQGAAASAAEHRLSRGQQALWFLYQLAPESTAYNIVSAVRIPGELDVAALRRAFQALVDRHPTLRTTFTSGDAGPVQHIHEYVEVHFREADATAWSETALGEVLIDEAHAPFNLEEGPLLRLSLFARSAREHVLLLAVHHIVVDFWSLAVLMHELEILYQAEKTGTQATLAPLPLQYTDYVRWQEEMLSGPEGERLWTYWQQQLGGELPLLNLPTDRPRPRVQTYRGASYAFALSSELTVGLKTLSRDRGATLYMTLLAALQVLLHRYTHQEEILVGSPTAGRNWAAVSDMVGYFVNPVVLRADFSTGQTFEEFLGDVRRSVLASFENQDYPFALLVERLQPVRDPSHSPLFNVMFVLQKAHLLDKEGMASFALGEADARINLGELTFESLALEQRVAQVDLTLMMAEVTDGLACSLQYNTDLFDAATIERMSGHFQTLLEAIVATPEKAVAELPVLNAAEREQLLVEWNQTAKEYPEQRCLHQLFEEQVERTPEAVAVVYQDEQVTYAELNRRANQLAHYLRGMGVGPEVLVGICVERSVEMVVGLLGILKAGGAYVPLDPEYPRERLGFMLEDAQVSLLLTQQRLAQRIPDYGSDVLYLDSQWDTIQRESEENPAGKVTPANLAYVIYTSGSTGQPKGVLATHQAVCNRLLWGQDVYPLTSYDRVLQGAAFGFDFSVWEFFAPLLAGSALIVGSSEEMQDSEHLVELLVAQQVTVAHFVPAHLEVLLEQPGLQSSRLRLVFSGGEALSRALQQRFSTLLSSVLFNQYGPTEATIDATSYACLDGVEHSAVPIGRPIANTEIYLLDAQLEPVPVGVPGELYIGGAGLARGYLKRPDLTAERFVPHPFSTEPGARLYRTGDLAKYLPDGNIEFLGRIDQQIKLRGYRIELGEIETVLGQHPEIEQAVVTLTAQGSEPRLVAYLVAARELQHGELRSYLKERLPDYMIPSAFVQLAELPLTPNGKIDRRALPAPEEGRLEAGQEYVAAQTPVEELLVGIWEEVLGVERVGIHDNFFELGGHSLLATQLISRVRTAFGIEMPLRQLFESPTVDSLAEAVELGLRNGEGVLLPPLQPMPRVGEASLSFGQQRLWIIDQLEANSAVYTMPAAVQLKGELNFRALEQTFSEIIRRHEVLRTTFVTSEGSPLQHISTAADVTLPLVNLSHLAADERETEAQRLATAEAQRPFDLSLGPLFRVQVLRLSITEHILLCTMHHIVSDGWSMSILIREVAALYEAFSQGQPSPLPELSIQYADYALWQREWLTGEVLESQLSYWREQLSGAPSVLELPTDRPRPAVQSFRGAVHRIELSAELTEALRKISRAEGVTLFMTLLSAFSVLLSRLSGQADIVVGTPIANRTRVETEGLIGFFVNTLVLRTKVEARESFRALLARVREVTLGAYSHQEVPFEKLVEELQPDRDLSHSPLFQVMFVLQNAPRETLRLGEVELQAAGATNETAKFDLTLELMESRDGLAGTIEYSTELFAAETVERWGGHFQTLLEAIVATPEKAVAELPVLNAAEREQLLVEWNQTAKEYPEQRCLHELFEEQVERTPEAVAIVYENQQITYGELNSRANQLAHYLRGMGVGPEVLVGICVERSVEMVVGLLGILKAGGAYVPLDPEYPRERLSFMLEDARIKILLTQEHLGALLHSRAVEVVELDSEWEAVARERVENPASGVVGQSLAYMIYTSGSTGKPKGVMVCHTNVVNFFAGMDSRVGDEEAGTWLAVTSISFDISALELFWTLARGYKVVIQGGAQQDFKADEDYAIAAQISRQQITHMQCTPSMARMLAIEPESLGALKSLRKLLLGGEALPVSLAAQLKTELPCELHNMYGPTETTIWSTTHLIEQVGSSVPLGRPIANTDIFILDQYLQPVPIGVPGELYIGGDGVVRGYLKRPELTAERFIPDPHGARPGARLYKTGDRARYLPDGNIEFLGRVDQQIKLHGHRIELGEIEAALNAHAAVRAAVVILAAQGTEQRLVAYLVKQEHEETLSAGELRSYLRERLPEYMIPSAFVELAELPLTPNGKIDRRALPAPEEGRLESGKEYVAPQTPVEETLVKLWEEVLGVERVGVHDNFFELGGHSLLATQLASRLRVAFEMELPLRIIFESPTVARLAAAIEQRQSEAVNEEEKYQILAQINQLSDEEVRLLLASRDDRA